MQIAEQRVGDPEHRQRGGEQYWRLEPAELGQLRAAHHLAESVEHREAGRQRRCASQQIIVHDSGDAGPDVGARHDGSVPDPDAGDVGDRVRWPGGQVAGC